MPINGAPTEQELEQTVQLILTKARRLERVRWVEFSVARVRLCTREQLRWVEDRVRAEGFEVDWVRHG